VFSSAVSHDFYLKRGKEKKKKKRWKTCAPPNE